VHNVYFNVEWTWDLIFGRVIFRTQITLKSAIIKILSCAKALQVCVEKYAVYYFFCNFCSFYVVSHFLQNGSFREPRDSWVKWLMSHLWAIRLIQLWVTWAGEPLSHLSHLTHREPLVSDGSWAIWSWFFEVAHRWLIFRGSFSWAIW